MTDFHNPYHFIPVKGGGRGTDLEVTSFPANRGHVTHDRYCPGAYSGRIICRLTTEGPTFIGSQRASEATAEAPAEVRHFELDGQPAIPASTLRGLLSSIAEAASNSALRVLDDVKYSYRRLMDPSQVLSAVGMVTAEPDDEGSAGYRLRPLTLPSLDFKNGQTISLDPQWKSLYSEPNLKVYIGDRKSITHPSFPFQTFSCEYPRYYGLKLRPRTWDNGSVGRIARDSDMYIKRDRFLIAQLPLDAGGRRRDSQPRPWEEIPDDEKPGYTRGILRVLGCGKDRQDIPTTKKHELFIPYPTGAESWRDFPIQEHAVQRFHELATQRTKASAGNPSPWPYEPRGTRRNGNPAKEGNNFRLKTGDLVWFRPSGNGSEIAEVSLSSIWRGRVEASDNKAAGTHAFFAEKLDANLLPFTSSRTMITLAEQLFGFVNSSKAEATKPVGALASRVYFSHAQIEGFRNARDDNWEPNGRGLQNPYQDTVLLKILDAPKAPSPALYFKRATGKAGYIAKRELKPGRHHPQGRKFYLHHRESEVNKPRAEPWRSQNLNERLQQKVRIGPLKPRAVFYFHVDFENLSAHEVGLLLYSLRPADDFRHKVGMGKPIGLGRVRIDPVGFLRVDRQKRYTADTLFAPRYSESWVRSGENVSEWPSRYKGEKESDRGGLDAADIRETFGSQMDSDIKRAIEMLGNPKALRAPVHTPLLIGQQPEDETFKWFVENDRRAVARDSHERPAFLTPLPETPGGMPVLPSYPQGENRDENG